MKKIIIFLFFLGFLTIKGGDRIRHVSCYDPLVPKQKIKDFEKYYIKQGKRYLCVQCGKLCIESMIIRHAQKHFDSNGGSYYCVMCPKHYKESRLLTIHINNEHSGLAKEAIRYLHQNSLATHEEVQAALVLLGLR